MLGSGTNKKMPRVVLLWDLKRMHDTGLAAIRCILATERDWAGKSPAKTKPSH